MKGSALLISSIALSVACGIAPAAPTRPDLNGSLFTAVKSDKLALTRTLLTLGVDPNIRESTDRATPLILAAQRGDATLVSLLLGRKANPRIAANDGTTPLIAAVSSSNSEIIRLILSRNVNVNSRRLDGTTALSLAADEGIVEPVKLLLAHGANVSESYQNWTALHSAAYGANRKTGASELDVINLLLDHGADINKDALNGGTPLMCAAAKRDAPAVRLLLIRGAKVNVHAATDGNTALLVAASTGDRDVLKALLEFGADYTLKNKKGQTPLMIALTVKIQTSKELLQMYGATR